LRHAIRLFLSKGQDIKQTGGAIINGRPLVIGEVACRQKKEKEKKEVITRMLFKDSY